MQNCLSILGFLDAVYSVLQKSIPYRVLLYLEEMKKRGYKIMLYPMPLVAEKGKPWRGRMYGNASEVQRFFTKKGGYNEFILHYAKLAKGKIDAFLIGSELVSITKIADQHNNFPAVDELVNLASMVRKILGNGVKISYAADWSEYHHTDGGWYHLDKLWASYDIDFIGIDAYFPITDSDQSEYDPKEIKRGWDMGEGYDFYFSDENRNIKKPLTPQYAWKNIEWWWENPHIDPNGKQTNWIPKSKKIWFTEYGFPSVDCASNQPNMFFDSKSNESRFPKYSKGNVDIMAQRVGIQGTEERWKNSRCVERKFLWCWDARPYPFWPSLRSVWDDVDCWSIGHWIQGKVAKTLLSDVLGFLCSKAGLTKDDYDTSRIHSYVDGLYISARTSIRKIIEILQSIYFFDAVEKEGKIHFIPRYSKKPIQIKESELIIKAESNAQDACDIKRLQESDLPYSVDINFLNKSRQYSVCNQHATRSSVTTKKSITIDLPSVLNEYEAFHIAKTTLYNFWLECLQYSFALPMRYMFISPSDVITLEFCNRMHCIRVTSVEIGRNGIVKILGVSENLDIYKNDNCSIDVEDQHVDLNLGTHLEILDIPTLPQETGDYSNARVLIAACGMSNNWSGCNI
ncbi:MAG: glycoside hydrolase/phage tail family protein [Candidatus Lariskella arthropodorum]